MTKINTSEINRKLKCILLETNFCAICLENDQDLYDLETKVIVAGLGKSLSVKDSLKEIFGMHVNVFSEYVCSSCKDAAVRSYSFIRKTKETFILYKSLLYQLQLKIDDTTYLPYDASISSVLLNLDYPEVRRVDAQELIIPDPCKIVSPGFQKITLPGRKKASITNPKNVAIEETLETNEPEVQNVYYEVPIIEKYVCDCCNKIFPNKYKLISHMKIMQNKSDSSSKKINKELSLGYSFYQALNGVMKCPYCPRNPCIHKKYLISYQVQKDQNKGDIACPECPYLCKTYRTLIEHVNKDHLNLQSQCVLCRKAFYSKYKYERHIRACKPRGKGIFCQLCNAQFGKLEDIRMHNYDCEVNKKYNEIIRDVKSSLYQNSDTPDPLAKLCTDFPCGLCNEVFTDINSLHRHRYEKHKCRSEKQYHCSVCQVDCHNGHLLHEHLSTHGPDEIHKCLVCSKDFDSRLKYLRHTRTITHRLNVTPSFEDDNVRKNHFTCRACDKVFKCPKMYAYHMKKYHREEKICCELCSLEFHTKFRFLHHLNSTLHKMKIMPNVGLVKITCPECGTNFPNDKSLYDHIYNKHPDTIEKTIINTAEINNQSLNLKHKCDYCYLEFDTKEELSNHTKTCHLSYASKLIECGDCEYTTDDPNKLRNHTRYRHKLKICFCQVCGKRCKSLLLLKCHLRHHSSVGPKRIIKHKAQICDICGKVLCNGAAMKKHKRIHSGERPYECEYCEMTFISTSERKRHMQLKHLSESFSCPLCEKKFKSIAHVRMHVKKVHWKYNEPFDYKKLEGLSKDDYKIFVDRRKVDSFMELS